MGKQRTDRGLIGINSRVNSSRENNFALLTGLNLKSLIAVGRIKSIVLDELKLSYPNTPVLNSKPKIDLLINLNS